MTRSWAPLASGPPMAEAVAFLDAHDSDELPPDHPMAARVAFALAQRGRLGEAMALAASLRSLPLDLPEGIAIAEADALADVVSARIWVSWLEQSVDQVAVDIGRRLVSADGGCSLDPHRRLTVLYSLAASLMVGRHAGEPAVIADALDYLSTARSLAVMFEMGAIQRACNARMALLHVPSGDLATAKGLARAAIDGLDEAQIDDAPDRVAYMRFIADVVVQWALHYQGRAMDDDVLVRIREAMPRFSFDQPASIVAGHVLATAHLQRGEMRAARAALNFVLGGARFTEMGVWQHRPLITDAYLASISGDEQRALERVTDLTRAGAPGEALLVRATNLLAVGEYAAALAALAPVTGGQVRHGGLTFPVACAIEAVLLEQTGQSGLADQSMRRAIGAAEPSGALRLFGMHDPAVMVTLAERAVAARPHDRWARQILDFVRRMAADTAPPLTVARRPVVSEPAISERAVETSSSGAPSPLTARERQVLAMVNAGASQAQMARDLYVSLNTIKTHLRSIRQKLGVERTGEAAAVARGAGWLDVPD